MLTISRITSRVKMSQNRWAIFGPWFQKERELAEVSQRKAAKKADISVIQLSRIENGHSGIKRETLENLINSINVLSSGYKIDLAEALDRAGFSAPRNGVPPELASIGFDDLDHDDLREIADFIAFRKAQKEKK